MTKWIATLIMMLLFVLLMTNKEMEIKAIFNDYQYATAPRAKEIHVNRGRKIMRPSLLPFMLEVYSSGQDIEFAEAMIDSCDGKKGTLRLWEFVDDPETDPFIRTICMAHLLNRNQLRVWSLITEEDIDLIAQSNPAHVVYWKTLLLRYTGYSRMALSKDTFPERHKFKALFRECVAMYSLKEKQRSKLRKQSSSQTCFPSIVRRQPVTVTYCEA